MKISFVKRLLMCSVATFPLLVIGIGTPAKAQWITPPTVSNNPFGPTGPDGIPGTADDPIVGPGESFFAGIESGYTGGIYQRANRGVPGEVPGAILTADAKLRSEVLDLGNNKYRYIWKLTNRGSGDMVDYFDTNGSALPEFIKEVNNLGSPELDGSAEAPFDLTTAKNFEIQKLIGGPPVIGYWGGGWNPETNGTQAEWLIPSETEVPEPLTILGSAAALGIGITLKKRQKQIA